MMNVKHLALAAGPLGAIVLFIVLWLSGLSLAICCTAAITTLVATWWVFEPIPIPATSIIPFAAFPLAGVLTHSQVANAYGHTLILLLMGGFILSTAMEKSGAHRRLALTMVGIVGGTNGKRLVLGFMIASAVLSMWISNSATTLMLLPVAIAILEQTDEREKLAVPLLLGIAFAANIGGIGTPVGTPPNVIFMAHFNELAAVTGNEWSFLQWMKIGVPIVIVFVPIAWLWLTRGLTLARPIVVPHPGKWRAEELRVLIVFSITALLWITRTEPFGGWNGIIERVWSFDTGSGKLTGDSTVALLMSVVMFLIPNGKGGQLLDWETAVKIPWGLLLLFGSGLAIGMAFESSGLSKAVGEQLEHVTSWHIIFTILAICLFVTFLTEITSNTATTNLIMPILVAVCVANNKVLIAPEILMVPAAISASCAFMLPIATGPNAIVFGSGLIKTATMARTGLPLNLIGAVVITLMIYILLAT